MPLTLRVTDAPHRSLRSAAVLLFLLLGPLSAAPSPARASVEENDDAGVEEADLESLMDVDVTSVSKRVQKASRSPAAIFVISQEDIRRSGATVLPELLRMVPGLHVARVDSSHWAISSRGFTSEFSNKLLVLIDGRAIYSEPLFSSVIWNEHDLMLEDVDRIEVVRGPGGSLWGANAVNGVINIMTKSAKDTQGGLVSGLTGTHDTGIGAARWGGSVGEDVHYRVYGKYAARDAFELRSGHSAADAWDTGRVGSRVPRSRGPRRSRSTYGAASVTTRASTSSRSTSTAATGRSPTRSSRSGPRPPRSCTRARSSSRRSRSALARC